MANAWFTGIQFESKLLAPNFVRKNCGVKILNDLEGLPKKFAIPFRC